MKSGSILIIAAVLVGVAIVFRGQIGSLLAPGGSYLTGVGPIPPGASVSLMPMPVPAAGSPLSPLAQIFSSFTQSLSGARGRTSATAQASAGPPAIDLNPNDPVNQGLNLLDIIPNDTQVEPLTGPVADTNLLDFSSIDLGSVSPGLAGFTDPAIGLPDSVTA